LHSSRQRGSEIETKVGKLLFSNKMSGRMQSFETMKKSSFGKNWMVFDFLKKIGNF
jgi:hypothetical protein